MIGADEFVEMLKNSTLETLGQVSNFFFLIFALKTYNF